MCLLPPALLIVHLTILQDINTGRYMKLSAAAKSADWKLVSVPLIYMLLRVWSVVVDIAIYFLPEDARTHYIQSPVSAVFLILVVSY